MSTHISPSLLSWQFYLTSTPLKPAVLRHFLWPPFLLLLPDHKSFCGWAVLKARAAWQRGGSSAMSLEMGLQHLPAVRSGRALNPACRGHEPLNLCAHLCKHDLFGEMAHDFIEILQSIWMPESSVGILAFIQWSKITLALSGTGLLCCLSPPPAHKPFWSNSLVSPP